MNIREDLVREIGNEENRVQYDGNDELRIQRTAGVMAEAVVLLIQALGDYTEAMKVDVDENTADAMKAARYDVVYAWAAVQAATSNVAFNLRIDGDEAFKRCVDATKAGEEPDLSHL